MVCGAVFAPGEDIQLHFITTHLPKDGDSDESDDEINTEIQVTFHSNVSHRSIMRVVMDNVKQRYLFELCEAEDEFE